MKIVSDLAGGVGNVSVVFTDIEKMIICGFFILVVILIIMSIIYMRKKLVNEQ